jgi:hypothetical protein
MTKLSQFLSTALLVVSMATVTWAGDTQGPALPSPPPPPAECTTNCTNSQTTLPAPDPTVDTVDVVNVLVTWLVASIL